MKESYKFEKFREQSFPVYSSVQQGCGTLVIPHFHEAAELMAVISGTVVCSIHTMRFVCNPGDTVFIPPYSVDEARMLRDSWFVNICAANIALFPFMFLSKKECLKDYMFYIGAISGLIAQAQEIDRPASSPLSYLTRQAV